MSSVSPLLAQQQPLLSQTPTLETERLVLRAPRGSDWPFWCDFWLSDRADHIRDVEPTEALAWRAFGHAIGHWVMRGYGMFIITRRGDNTPIGMAGPWFPAGWPEQEIGWTLWDSTLEGQGYAAEAARAVVNYAFETLGWPTAVSYIAPANQRSAVLAERLGARLDLDAVGPAGHNVRVYRHAIPAPRLEAAQ